MFVWSLAMYRLHELLRHHPAYLLGRPRPLSYFERLERRPIINDEFRSAEFDAPAWRFADVVAAALVALAMWGLFMLPTSSTDNSPAVETIAESVDAMDRSR
jgi:hypothetical protein